MKKYLIATAAAALVLPAAAQSDKNEGGYHYKAALAIIENNSSDYVQKAFAELMSAMPDEPHNGNIYYWLGVLSEPDAEQTTKCYNTALLFLKPGEKSNLAQCATALASHMLDAGQTQKARELMEKVAKSKCADRNILLGNYYMDSRVADYAKAAKSYRNAIATAQTTELDDLYARLIVAQTIAGDHSGAQATIAEAQAKAPSGTLWKQAKCHFLYRAGNPEEALTALLNLCDEYPAVFDQSLTYDRMSLVSAIVGEAPSHAVATIRSFKPTNSWRPIFHFVSYSMSRLAPADYLDFCQEHTSEFDDPVGSAEAYERLFINAKAIALNFEKNGKINHNAMAYFRAKMGDTDGATAEMDTLVSLNRGKSLVYASYANLLSTYTDRYADALAYADTALALDPRNEHALFSRMWVLHVVKGDSDAAKEAANRLLSVIREKEELASAADNGDHLDSYGDIFVFNSALAKKRNTVSDLKPWAYLALGDKANVIAAVKDMLNPDNELRSNNEPMYRNLFAAEIYALLGMTDEAVAYMTKAMECGYRDFAFLDHTPNLANLRTNHSFNTLMEKYRDTYRHEIEKYSK